MAKKSVSRTPAQPALPPPQPALPPPPWGSPVSARARRGPRPQLDRDKIVAAALRIVDADGIEGFTIRRLADDLGVTPMSLYWHVADKAALLELVGHAVLDEIEIPAPAGDWREQLHDVHRAMLLGILRHPNTTEILLGRARYGAGGFALFERILSILLDAGFTAESAFDAYQSLYLFTLGFMATSTRSPEFREIHRQGAVYMSTLPAERYPAIRQVVPVMGRRPTEEQFDIGLDVVIEGIAARLAPASA